MLAVLLSFSCKDKSASKGTGINVNNASASNAKPVYDSLVKPRPFRANLKVSAHLIYDDGTLKNGRKLEIDTSVIHFEKNLEYVIRKTSCAEVNKPA